MPSEKRTVFNAAQPLISRLTQASETLVEPLDPLPEP
jgi:hypothetical protein